MILKFLKRTLIALLLLTFGIGLKTYSDLRPLDDLRNTLSTIQNLQVVDRNNRPLSISYQNRWNSYDYVPLHQIPALLQQAFIVSEDQHFYEHRGSDWTARLSALWTSLRHLKVVRGASTLSEQVVRMLHPRPRTLWSKWLETIEVRQLEAEFKKPDILEFYLNEVPFAHNRRGVVQAARYYFNRDLSTLSTKEMLALVVLARAPSSYDLYKNPKGIDAAIQRLAKRLQDTKHLTATELEHITSEKFDLKSPSEPVNAAHFVSHVRSQYAKRPHNAEPIKVIHTTLDSELQRTVQDLVDNRVKSLNAKGVHNGGAIVINHQTGEIVAWVVAGANRDPDTLLVPSDQIDTVTTPRQPGSALKPFLYTLALDKGWTPATLIDDSPLADAIGNGLHRFQNYSHTFYGKVTLRAALGNSLNIPALRTIKFTGIATYLNTLHQLGFSSLQQNQNFYDEGLALGNGEVTLLELTQAYAALAHQGVFREAHALLGDASPAPPQRVYSTEASSLIGNILSDPKARQLEFGVHSILNLPVQTAIKTGTSSDYNDAWVVGFNYKYAVGIWMGNLDRKPMQGVTGAIGPALTIRSIFAELTKNQETQALYLSPRLLKAEVCIDHKQTPCISYNEYFIKTPVEEKTPRSTITAYAVTLPTPGLQIALDPRIPRAQQKLPLQLNQVRRGDSVEWIIDGKTLATTTSGRYLWPLERGKFSLTTVVHHADNTSTPLSPIQFVVK
jgi:penicillin-binding protein 1C